METSGILNTPPECEIVTTRIFNFEECNKLKKFVLEKNEENMDRFEIELKKMQ